MPRLRVLVLVLVVALGARAAEPDRPFSATLTPEQKRQLGLEGWSATQLAALDAPVAPYTRGATRAVAHAVERQAAVEVEREAKVRAEQAVAEYRRKEEPGVVARALEIFKRDQEERMGERFSARIAGPFRGWTGTTTFQLDNGQVWKQASADEYVIRPIDSPTVEIFRAPSGHYRLRLEDGAWVTVKRLQ